MVGDNAEFEHLVPEGMPAPFAAYSHGVFVPSGMDLLFCSGQLGIAHDAHIPESVEAQTRLCFSNVRTILRSRDMDLSNVIRINAFVTAREHMQGYMRVRDELFPNPAPASTLVIVSGFTREEFLVEIEVVAGRDPRAS